MRVLYLTHRRETPSTRYRVAPFAVRLERDGHPVEVREYSSRILDLWPMLRSVCEADVVIVQKRLPPRWMTRALRRRARRLIYDYDDAVYLSHGLDGPRPHRGRMVRFEAIVKAADAVAAGNAYLGERARAAGARAVAVLPTALDPAKYDAAPRVPHEGVVAGWIGAGGNVRYLEPLLPRLRALGVRIRVVCDRFPEGVESVPWTEAGEAAALAGMDMGLAPLPDDDWTRGKCGTRVLQYFAARLPVVADGVGVHLDLVGDGGFVVTSSAEWARRIGELAGDPALRERMGRAGRARLQSGFTPDSVYPRLLDLLRG
ncbi:MAG: glycosyltransferase [Planctomycetes bacterium]|nr:glycosyltransferase [Planctomycetota bacterium]